MSGRERRYPNGTVRDLAFDWDGDDRLVAVRDLDLSNWTVWQARYDAGGLRQWKQDDTGGGEHHYVWGTGRSPLPNIVSQTLT